MADYVAVRLDNKTVKIAADASDDVVTLLAQVTLEHFNPQTSTTVFVDVLRLVLDVAKETGEAVYDEHVAELRAALDKFEKYTNREPSNLME